MGLCTLMFLSVIVVAVFGDELTSDDVQNWSRSDGEFEVDDNIEEGRKVKHKFKGKHIMYLLVAVKLLAATVLLPSLLALALYTSWKGITISLLAFTVASIVGIKNLFNSKSNQDSSRTHHVIVSKLPSQTNHEYWQRRSYEDPFSDQLSAYRGHKHY